MFNYHRTTTAKQPSPAPSHGAADVGVTIGNMENIVAPMNKLSWLNYFKGRTQHFS